MFICILAAKICLEFVRFLGRASHVKRYKIYRNTDTHTDELLVLTYINPVVKEIRKKKYRKKYILISCDIIFVNKMTHESENNMFVCNLLLVITRQVFCISLGLWHFLFGDFNVIEKSIIYFVYIFLRISFQILSTF